MMGEEMRDDVMAWNEWEYEGEMEDEESVSRVGEGNQEKGWI